MYLLIYDTIAHQKMNSVIRQKHSATHNFASKLIQITNSLHKKGGIGILTCKWLQVNCDTWVERLDVCEQNDICLKVRKCA